jgi:ATP-dependent Clp protease adaptor protein ClpS
MKEKSELSENYLLDSEDKKFLILHNDDIHTFDYVIDALVDVCNHTMVQAEQCTMLIHFKGKCAVKEGPFPVLKQMKERLIKRELEVTID